MRKLITSIRISKRLLLMNFLALLGLLVVCGIALYQLRESMLNERRAKITALVDVAYSQLAFYEDQVAKGKMAKEVAQELAKSAFRLTRYQAKEYFWINDYRPYSVVHPVKPALEGKDMSGTVDAVGKHIYIEFVRAAQAGGGFVDYQWTQPNSEQALPKLSYVRAFEPWGWVIGTGVYIDDINAQFRNNSLTLIFVSAMVLVVLMLFGLVVRYSIIRQLGGEPHQAAEVFEQIAGGDLTVVVNYKHSDSMLGSLQKMLDSLREIVLEVTHGALELVKNAGSIRDVAAGVALSAQRQADATSDIAAAIEELTTSSSQISENAGDTEEESKTAMAIAREGYDRVSSAATSIESISRTVRDAAGRVRALEERAGHVSEVARVIKDIAGQTNLLALNAAIEAARAGEQGRGFAVVADEVRKLSERTSLATTEIDQMIAGIQEDTGGVVLSINNVLPEVERGVMLAQAASESLGTIESSVARTLSRIADVASATREQSAASTAMAKRVEEIAGLVDQTTSSIRSTAEATAYLEGVAQKLKAQVSRFRISE